MARRILSVERTSLFRDPDKELFVDAYVDVDWKLRMFIDDWTGEIETANPTYKIRPRENDPSEFNEYGVLSEPDDIAWLNRAMTKPIGDLRYQAIPIVARVNELGTVDSAGKRGFKIEVLTGQDAENLINAEKRDAAVHFVKEHWWQIGIALALAWWWFF